MPDDQTTQIQERMLNPAEAAEYIGVDQCQLQQWRWCRKGPAYIKYSQRCIAYRESDLIAFMNERAVSHS